MNVRRRTVLTAPLAAAGLLAGCASGAEDGSTTLTFLNAHSGQFTNVVEAFEATHPEVKVDLQSVPFEQLIEQTQARLASGDSSIDILAVDPPRLPDMVEQGFLTDESAHLDAMRETASEVGITSVTAQDKQWSYPLWTSDNFLFYNQDVLEAAGVEPPGPLDADRLTWEDVLEASRTVIDAGEARYGLAIDQVSRYYALQPLIESFGAGPGLAGSDNLTPKVDTPEWIAFNEWYGEQFETGIIPRGVDPAQMFDVFRSGQSAFFLAGAESISKLSDGSFGGTWGMAPHPYFDDGPVVTPTDSWAIGISATSQHQELAREFAQFATLDVDGAREASSLVSMIPVNTAAFDIYVDTLAELAPEQTEGFAELFRTDSREHARHRPTSTGYVQFETTMNHALTDVSNGAEATGVLENAQQTLVRQLDRRRELARDTTNS